MHPSWRQYHYHTTLHLFSNSTFSQISMTTSLTRPTHIGGQPSPLSGNAFPMTTTLQTFASGNDDYKIYQHRYPRLPSPPKTAFHNLYLLLVVMVMVPLLTGDRSVCPIIICDDEESIRFLSPLQHYCIQGSTSRKFNDRDKEPLNPTI